MNEQPIHDFNHPHFLFGSFKWYRKWLGGYWYQGPSSGMWYREGKRFVPKTEDYR